MTVLSITAKGQITLKKDLLTHLGVHPGDKLDVVMMPGGQLHLKPARPRQTIDSLFGLLKSRPGPPVTDEEIEAGIGQGAVDSYLRSIGQGPDREDDAA